MNVRKHALRLFSAASIETVWAAGIQVAVGTLSGEVRNRRPTFTPNRLCCRSASAETGR